MKKLTILVIIACVGLLFAPAAAISGPPEPYVMPVNVANTPDVNVANTPDVNVANTPDVNVANEPVVKAQQDGEWSVNIEPTVSKVVQVRSEISYGSPVVDIYEVPDGYLLVIEYISFGIIGQDSFFAVYNVTIQTHSGSQVIDHYINVPSVINHVVTADHARSSGGQVTRLYADPNSKVRANFTVGGDTWYGWVVVSGRLVQSD